MSSSLDVTLKIMNLFWRDTVLIYVRKRRMEGEFHQCSPPPTFNCNSIRRKMASRKRAEPTIHIPTLVFWIYEHWKMARAFSYFCHWWAYSCSFDAFQLPFLLLASAPSHICLSSPCCPWLHWLSRRSDRCLSQPNLEMLSLNPFLYAQDCESRYSWILPFLLLLVSHIKGVPWNYWRVGLYAWLHLHYCGFCFDQQGIVWCPLPVSNMWTGLEHTRKADIVAFQNWQAKDFWISVSWICIETAVSCLCASVYFLISVDL